jgi:SAM-dependent methyltransferase
VTAVLPSPPAGARWFGQGGAEPWAGALDGARSLFLVSPHGRARMASERWAEACDAADRTTLDGLSGPVLDIGCGPGRMVRAALDAGLAALGVDVSAAAVAHCRDAGLPVLHRSVFAPLPNEGRWSGALLLDGNIGIGGDVAALLSRCHDLLAVGGALVSETHPDPHRDTVSISTLVDDRGRESDPFPWAEVGEVPLLAAAAGFREDRTWSVAGRRFLRLVREP